MMRVLFLVLLLSFFSCKPDIPENIMPPKKMQAVLWDLMQADEVADYYIPTDSVYRLTAKRHEMYQTIFGLHKTTKQDFERSYDWYQAHPKLLAVIFDSLQASGERLQRQPLDTISRPIIDSNIKKGRPLQAN